MKKTLINFMINILIAEILLIPWAFLPVKGIDCVRLPKAILFDLFCMAIICFGIFKGLNFSYKNRYLAILSAWIFVTIGFNWYYPLLMNIGFNATTIESSIHFLLAVISSFFVMSYLNKDDYLKLSKFICYSSMAVSTFAIFQVLGFDPLKIIATYKHTEPNHVCALIDHPDTLGNFLAMTIPFFFLYLREYKFRFGLFLVFLIIFATHSTLSMGAAIVTSIFFLFLKYRSPLQKRLLIILFIVFGIFCALTPSFNKINGSFTGRIEVWKKSVHFIQMNPLFGQGLGIFRSFGISTGMNAVGESGNNWVAAHNDYIEIVCAIGFLGLFLFLLVICHSFRNFNYKPDNLVGFSYIASFLGFLLIMIGSFPMEMAPLSLMGLFGFWGTEKV